MLRRSARVDDRDTLTQDFRDKFIQYANSQGEDQEAYQWLILRSTEMQIEMGRNGVMDFKPPAANYYIKNYQLILNALPEIRRYLAENRRYGMFATTLESYIHMVDEALTRHIGSLRAARKRADDRLRNPLAWFQAGMETVLAGPFLLLSAFGLLGGTTVRAIRSAFLFKTLSRVATLIAFIGAVVGLFVDWPQALDRAKSFFGY